MAATLHPNILTCAFWHPGTALPRVICISTSLTEEAQRNGALACMSRDPFRSVGTGACRLLLQKLQSSQVLQGPPFHGLPGHPVSPGLVDSCTDFTRAWCRTGVTLTAVPSSAHDFSWLLHIAHRLLNCPACGQRHLPNFQICPEMLHPPPPFRGTLCTSLYADFLCMLAAPLEFEGPPPGVCIEWTQHFMSMV
jgi:hypothetical protein